MLQKALFERFHQYIGVKGNHGVQGYAFISAVMDGRHGAGISVMGSGFDPRGEFVQAHGLRNIT
jgi:hypothetical protein